MANLSSKKHSRALLALRALSGSALFSSALLGAILLAPVSWAQSTTSSSFMRVTVNSPVDGPVKADSAMTLREAIEVMNGTLRLSDLSEDERQLVSNSQSQFQIHFDLPVGQTAIELTAVLPSIVRAGLVIDGGTQPGYDAERSATAEILVPVPVVTIRPAANTSVFRGLTVAADNVTVRGLNLYGFNASSQITQTTPPADIFISHKPIPQNREQSLPDMKGASFNNEPPTGVVIEQNWLGLTLEETIPIDPSGFGVFVFDSGGTTIRQNRIEYHNGSGIISGRQADNLNVIENIIVSNGLSGMPDAIRLDGQIREGLIANNLICGNDGSGVFLFKPDGSVTIDDNDIRYNGQRLRRAAVYLMGDDHRVTNNDIAFQKGSGVAVTAYGQGSNTQSIGNVVTGNRFDGNEGLSIDLNVRRDRTPQDFQRGDGPNPARNSRNRRQDTGNGAVNAPQFVSPEFFIINNTVAIRGQADPNNEVQLYRSVGEANEHGPLTLPLQTTTVDDTGAFEFVLSGFAGGEMLSAIATDPRYGTSEPATNTVVLALSGEVPTPSVERTRLLGCTTPPIPLALSEAPDLSPTNETPALPETIQLEVPRNVHFGLDRDTVSAESAKVLDKIAAVLKQYPTITVELYGHTDSRASQAYNQDLARRRAENTRRYLLSQGIESERMTLRSLGETELLVAETDRTNYARNRRVEFVFTDSAGSEIDFINQENDLQIEP